jgi:hypothetical protein
MRLRLSSQATCVIVLFLSGCGETRVQDLTVEEFKQIDPRAQVEMFDSTLTSEEWGYWMLGIQQTPDTSIRNDMTIGEVIALGKRLHAQGYRFQPTN